MTDAAAHDRTGVERRRWPRFEAGDKLLGVLMAADLPVRIRDVGVGGFSVETVEPLAIGLRGPVRFMSVDDWTAVLPAESLHCRPSVAIDGTPRYVTGFAFVGRDEPESRELIVDLIAKVTSVRVIDV